MNLPYYVERMRHQAAAITNLIQDVSLEQARWKPSPDEWSILEVINHLYDEEMEDFRIRLEITLHDPEAPWPPNDPGVKVVERNYNGQELMPSLQKFLEERKGSLDWLESLDMPEWSNEHKFPQGWSLRAGDLLASWVAHDLLHLRQLVELHFYYQRQLAQPYSVDYAGDW